MKFPLKTTIAAIALFAATPTMAAVTFDDPSDETTISFDGTVEGASATLFLDLVSISGGVFTFDYTLTNTSDATLNPELQITSFGFNDSGTATDADIIDGFFTKIIADGGTGPGPFGGIDVCLNNSNGSGDACSGPNGVTTSGSGTFSLTYLGLTSLTLSDFAVRYQSTGLDGEGSGTGTEVPPVPEPATWAMMLLGFGAVGYSMRRRRKTFLPQVA